jgi:hypothetical protein
VHIHDHSNHQISFKQHTVLKNYFKHCSGAIIHTEAINLKKMRYIIPRIAKHERNDAIRFYSIAYGLAVSSRFMKNDSIEYAGQESQSAGVMPACNFKPG